MPGVPRQLVLDPAFQALLFREARTARTFTDDPVTDEQIAAIHDLIRWAPTAANCQPLRIVVVRSPEAKARLLPHMNEGNRAQTAQAPVTLVLAADLRFHRYWSRTNPGRPRGGARFAADPQSAERFALTNATLQIGYLVVGIRAAGLGVGPMGGFDGAGLDAELFPEADRRTLMVMNVGHPGPDAWSDRLPRLDADDVITTL